MVAPGLELDDSAFSPAWPSFLPTEIEICVTNPEDTVFTSPNKVLVNGKTVCFFKLYQPGDTNRALGELGNYKRITASILDPAVRICRLFSLIKDEENQPIGLLLTYIACDFLTLTCAAEAGTPDSIKQKWVDQVTAILTQLHKAGIVWGDAKPDNVLIDKNVPADSSPASLHFFFLALPASGTELCHVHFSTSFSFGRCDEAIQSP